MNEKNKNKLFFLKAAPMVDEISQFHTQNFRKEERFSLNFGISTTTKKFFFPKGSSLNEKGRKFWLGLIKIRKVLPEKSFRVPFFWHHGRLCSGFLLRPRTSSNYLNCDYENYFSVGISRQFFC